MPGLEVAVLAIASEAGIDLSLGRRADWLSGRGHLDEMVQDHAPVSDIEALAAVHERLGGNASLLATKRVGNRPTPDLVHRPTGTIIEVDEVQHFSSARALSLDLYPPGADLGFDRVHYQELISTWREKADKAFAHKTAKDFPAAGGRQAQRAYNDALRDLLAPTFTNRPVIRLAVPDRSMANVVEQLLRHFPEG